MPALPIEEYQVGWVCALPKEMAAARAMLDEEHGPMPSQDAHDHNNYVLGHVHNHNVVIACLPAAVDGTNAAATIATNMLRTFKGLRFGLLVGIGGGIPNLDKGVDIRLGDVVVSQPDKTYGGVVQYDKGKSLEGGQFERKGSLNKPPSLLLSALASLQGQYEVHGSQMSTYLRRMIEQHPNMEENGYTFPGVEHDCLYCSHCQPTSNKQCDKCQDGKLRRKQRRSTKPVVHYGIIASGNQVVKDSVVRDRLGKEFEAKCVEMEAAGLMDDFPCLVIRGVCDYVDAYKNDVWHRYAATTAAAYAKEFLSIIPQQAVSQISCVSDVMKYRLGLNLFGAPNIGNDLFIGREAELQHMESVLQPQSDSLKSTQNILVLGGMGGIGKTQLAITYAKRHRHSYSSIFWLNASTEATLNNSLRKMVNRILPPETVSKLEYDQVWVYASNWLSHLDNTRWLLIFDNYDEPDQYKLTEYFPSVFEGSIVVTTRQPDRINGVQVKVRSISEKEESLRILATRSGRENATSDPDARKLAERLDGHPLALATAGAFLSQSSVSFHKYLQQYEAKWKVIDSVTELSDYPSRTLYSTWDMSFAQIQQQNGRAAHLLKFLAYLDNRDIWHDLLHHCQSADQPGWFTELAGDEFVFEDAMQTLTRYCLVESQYQTGSYSLHVCVHDWTIDGLNRDIDVTQYWLAVDCVYSHVSDSEWGDLFSLQYRRLNAHAERLLHDRFREAVNASTLSLEIFDRLDKIAELLTRQVQHRAAEQMYLWALAGCEQALVPEHILTLDIVNNMGNLYVNQGTLDQAETMYKRALAGKEKTLGLEHTSTLDIVNNLGNLYVKQGKLNQAEAMYERALIGKEKTLGLKHTSTLDTVNNLGILYINQDKLDQAEAILKQALAEYEKISLSETISALNTIHNLGLLYHKQGKMKDAKIMFQRALLGRDKVLGSDHKQTLELVNYLEELSLDQREQPHRRRYPSKELEKSCSQLRSST